MNILVTIILIRYVKQYNVWFRNVCGNVFYLCIYQNIKDYKFNYYVYV